MASMPEAPQSAQRHIRALAQIDRMRLEARTRAGRPESSAAPDRSTAPADDLHPVHRAASRGVPTAVQPPPGALFTSIPASPSFRLDDFAVSDFDPHEFVESAVKDRLAAATSHAHPSAATRFSPALLNPFASNSLAPGGDIFDPTQSLHALAQVDAALRALRSSAVANEDEARESLRRALATAGTAAPTLATSLSATRTRLEAHENAIDQATGTLAAILGPIRAAAAEKACLLDARDATAIMTERPEGVEIVRAARLLRKLGDVVREAQSRGMTTGPFRRAEEKIARWSQDLAHTVEEWFFVFLEGDNANEARTAQCATAAFELNGGADLIQRYVASRPFFHKVPKLSGTVNSPNDDPDGTECAEVIHDTRRRCMETIRLEMPRISVAFPDPAAVVTSLVQRLITHKLSVAAELVLASLEEQAILAEMAVAVDGVTEDNHFSASSPGMATTLHRKAKKRDPEILSTNQTILKLNAAQRRRRYLCTLAEASSLMLSSGEEMATYMAQLGATMFDCIGFAKRALLPRKEAYVHLEQSWLQCMIEVAFRDAMEIPRTLHKPSLTSNDATLYMKYRAYASRLSTFTAMTQRAIASCLESLQRCRTVEPKNPEEASESLARTFVGNFITVAEEALSVAINVIPKSEKVASKADYWAQGSPIGLYAAALEQVRNSLVDIDQFFESISNDEVTAQSGLPVVLPPSTSSYIREELRSSLTRLESFSETGLELAAMAVASRIARTLEKEQRRPLEYSIGDDGDMSSAAGLSPNDISMMDDDEEVTPAFAKCCSFLEQQVHGLTVALTEKNLEYALSMMSNAVRLAVLAHWQKLKGPITPLGGLRLMSDARALQKCFRACESAETELSVLVEIGNIFVLAPPKIWTLVEDGALKRMDGQILAKLLEQRPDYRTAKLKKLAAALAPDGDTSTRARVRWNGEQGDLRRSASVDARRSGSVSQARSPGHRVRFTDEQLPAWSGSLA